VARARAASIAASSRLPRPERARSVSRASAAATRAASRVARMRSSPATCARRTDSLSMSSTSSSSSRPGRYLLTPTITSSPRSTRAWRRAAHSSIRSFGMPSWIARVMPPSASTSPITRRASAATLAVSDSMK